MACFGSAIGAGLASLALSSFLAGTGSSIFFVGCTGAGVALGSVTFVGTGEGLAGAAGAWAITTGAASKEASKARASERFMCLLPG